MVRQHFYNCFGHVNLIELDKSIVFPFAEFLCLCFLPDKKEECKQMDINRNKPSPSVTHFVYN